MGQGVRIVWNTIIIHLLGVIPNNEGQNPVHILILVQSRPFDTISDFSISKLKWCPNHMDYKFKEFSGLAFLSLANRPSEVWHFFHFEFSLPLLWLVDSKFLRKYFSKILNRPIREEIGKIQNSIIKFLSSDFRIWCNLVF